MNGQGFDFPQAQEKIQRSGDLLLAFGVRYLARQVQYSACVVVVRWFGLSRDGCDGRPSIALSPSKWRQTDVYASQFCAFKVLMQ